MQELQHGLGATQGLILHYLCNARHCNSTNQARTGEAYPVAAFRDTHASVDAPPVVKRPPSAVRLSGRVRLDALGACLRAGGVVATAAQLHAMAAFLAHHSLRALGGLSITP